MTSAFTLPGLLRPLLKRERPTDGQWDAAKGRRPGRLWNVRTVLELLDQIKSGSGLVSESTVEQTLSCGGNALLVEHGLDGVVEEVGCRVADAGAARSGSGSRSAVAVERGAQFNWVSPETPTRSVLKVSSSDSQRFYVSNTLQAGWRARYGRHLPDCL